MDRYSFFRDHWKILQKSLCEQNTSSQFMAKKENFIPVSLYRKEAGWLVCGC